MIYGLDDDIKGKSLWVYVLQHLAFIVAGITIMPIAAGAQLGLSQAETAEMLQRSFFVLGIMSFLQVKFGHKYPILDGPAGLWTGMFLISASMAVEAGRPLAVLRAELELSIMAAGVVLMLIVSLGLLKWILKLFTPLVNGVIITTMVLQMSITFVRGVVGLDAEGRVTGSSPLICLITIAVILFVTVYMRGFVQSIATLIGVIVGWLFAAVLGIWVVPSAPENIFSLPALLPWGTPILNPGVMASCVIGEILLMSMTLTSVNSMSGAVKETADEKTLGRSLLLQGLGTVLSGIFPIVPPMPYISSTGVVLMTGVASRKPFMIAVILIAVFGLLTPISVSIASMPPLVAYSTTIVIFALIFGQGLREFKKCELDNRESYVVGISMIIGIGTMFLPSTALSALPQSIRLLLSNGLVVGTVLSMILEKTLAIKPREKQS
ncbi:MAG: purine/pyrimidine permease [Clostridiales Family XIII bacterium]|jgi:xanthine/uracil permease|nr:purine/pyrimidine permease [Clostridiales Family XIII bacterium]